MTLIFLLLSSLAFAEEPATLESLSFDVGARQELLPEKTYACGELFFEKLNIGVGSSLLCSEGTLGIFCTTTNPATTYWGNDSWSPKFSTIVLINGRKVSKEALVIQKARLDVCFAQGIEPSERHVIDPTTALRFAMPHF